MRRAVISALLALAVVLLQVTVVDRLPLPGGIVPDVALVTVVAIGLTHGPITGTIGGFLTGLDLDLVPPGGHLIGESALIFCMTGYACGRLGIWLERSVPRLLAAAVVGVGAGEILRAGVGLIASDPGVTLSAVRHVLPGTVLYDVLLCPIVLFLTALASRRPISPLRLRSLFRRRVRICRQVPRWPSGRPAVLGALADSTGRTGHVGRTSRTSRTGHTGHVGRTSRTGRTGHVGRTSRIGRTGHTGHVGRASRTSRTGRMGWPP
jgi:rod shape-determining protein MreD